MLSVISNKASNTPKVLPGVQTPVLKNKVVEAKCDMKYICKGPICVISQK